jgi:uncharacterized membrane protein
MEETTVPKHSERELTPSFELIKPSWNALKLNVVSFLILGLLPVVYFLVVSVLATGTRIGLSSSGAQSETVNSAFAGTFSLVMLLGVVLALIIAPGMFYLQLQSARGKRTEAIEAIKVGLKYFWKFIGLSILTGLLVVGGLILFIVPGIIMIRRYFLSPFYLIDKDLKIGEAMRKSAEDSKPVSGSIYGVLGVTILFAIAAGVLGYIPVIGAVAGAVIQLVYYCAPALRYDEVRTLA